MALLFCDSFDHYLNADILKKWTTLVNTPSIAIGATQPPGGGNVLAATVNANQSATKNIPATATLIMGVWVYFTTLPSGIIMGFYDGGSAQVTVQGDGAGHLKLNAAAQLGSTSTATIVINTWYHLELKVAISDAAGTYELRLSGVAIVGPGTGADTKQTANASADSIRLGGAVNAYFKHVYVLDTTGAVANDFIGQALVKALRPVAAGNYSQWTPSAGNNLGTVDDMFGDSDMSFNMSSGSDSIDTFGVEDVGIASGTIFGIQHVFMAKQDGGSARQVAALQRSSGSDFVGVTKNMAASWLFYLDPYSINPATGAGYTLSEINALEAGYKLIT